MFGRKQASPAFTQHMLFLPVAPETSTDVLGQEVGSGAVPLPS